jgi:CelD/BcsL family acetyltransferase involved in cellulose biosynthesis
MNQPNPNPPRPGDLATEVVSHTAELERRRGDWEALLARSGTNQITQTPFWLLAWWRIFGPLDGRRLVAALFFDGERLVGLAPMLVRAHRYHRVLPFRRLELLATGEPEADEIVSEYLGLVIERGYEAAVVDAFAGALADGKLGAWDELVLSLMDDEAPASALLEPALARRGLEVTTARRGTAPYIKLPKDWNGYLAALSGSGRYMVKRSIKDFEKWAGGKARFAHASTSAELERGQRVLMQLHEARWKAAGQDGVFASHAFRSFHDGILRELLARGALDLSWLCVDDQPVAVSYSLVWNNRVQFYQGGRTTEVPKGVRPGIVLHAHAFQAAIAAGREEYDFLSGASQYKMQMATHTRSLLQVRAIRPGYRETARQLADRGVELLRQARRRWRELEARGRGGGGDGAGAAGGQPNGTSAPAPGGPADGSVAAAEAGGAAADK